MSTQIRKMTELLQRLEADRFYGRLELQYRAGSIELVREEKTIKLQGDTHAAQLK